MQQPKQEVCTIRIMFPVVSDEKAIEYKKRLTEVLKDNPDATMQFSLMGIPQNITSGS
ncbi:unnamed protein product [marine sediment metagenome]|uniref:Uncharacterized protein n=1 Tax=marine sediment metagenome TaxID=412755 RepID=X1QUM2_9ZZZZ